MLLPHHSLDSPEFHRFLVESAPDLISRHSLEGSYLFASPACRDLTGFEPQEMVGKSLCDLLPYSLDWERVRKVFLSLKNQSAPQTVDYRLKCKDGNYIWLESTFKPVRTSQSNATQEVLAYSRNVSRNKRTEAALQFLSRGNDAITADDFFRPLVSHVAAALQVNYAFITESDPEHTRVRMLAFWKGDDFGNPAEYDLKDTPCDAVINEGKVCHYPLGIQALFPKDQDLTALNAQGYVGIPINDLDGKIIGHLAILHRKPLNIEDSQLWVLKIFAARAGMEIERLRRSQAQ